MYTWENKIQRDEITCSLLFSPAVIPDVLLGRKDSLTKTDIAFEEPKNLRTHPGVGVGTNKEVIILQ